MYNEERYERIDGQAGDFGIESFEIVPVRTVKRERKQNRFLMTTMAACLVAAVGGSSIGLGIGVGGRLMGGLSDNQPQVVAAAYEVSGMKIEDNAVSMALASTNTSIVDVVKEVSSAVVSINVTAARAVFNQIFPTSSAGSGIVIGEDSTKIYIATNNHVIENATDVTISLDDTKQIKANKVGSDYQSDLAVLSVTKEALQAAGATGYKIASVGNSKKAEVGEVVIAIGNAAGEGKTATMGIISAKDKIISIDNRELSVLQTDAAINPGNSGGALVNMQGQVIGINTAKLSEVGVEGMGYSIPIEDAKVIFDQMIANGGASASVSRPYLGISGVNVDESLRRAYQLASTGIYIDSVLSNSSAADAGLRRGDIIVSFGQTKMNSMDDLTAALATKKVGDKVDVGIYRSSNQMTISVTLKDLNQRF